MIYTRDSKNILDAVDLQTALQSPFDSEFWLNSTITLLNNTTHLSTPIVLKQKSLDAFCDTPKDYFVVCDTERICVAVKGKSTPTYFTWYDDSDNQIVAQADVNEDSLVFLQIQGSKLVFNDKIVHIICQPNIDRLTKFKVYFVDLFGQVQSMWFQSKGYTFENEIINTSIAYNGQLHYEIGKHPYYHIAVGESGLDWRLSLFLQGLSASNGYIIESLSRERMNATITETSLGADGLMNDLSISGILNIKISDYQKLTE